jgi:transposase
MDVDGLRDDQWERIKGFVPGGTRGKRGPRTDNRKFLDALLWMARSGGRWRDLPERLGDYRSVKGAITAGSRWGCSTTCSRSWPARRTWNG